MCGEFVVCLMGVFFARSAAVVCVLMSGGVAFLKMKRGRVSLDWPDRKEVRKMKVLRTSKRQQSCMVINGALL